jgi:hypothetical protein
LLCLLTTTPKSLSLHKHRKFLLLEIQKMHEFVHTSIGVGRKSLMKLVTSNHVVFGQSIEHSLQSKVEFLKELRLKDEELGLVVNFVVHCGLQGMLQNIMFLDNFSVKRDWIGIIVVLS